MNLLVMNQNIPIQYILHPKKLKNRILLTLSNIMSALLHMKLRDLPQTTHQTSLLLHTALKLEILTQIKGIGKITAHALLADGYAVVFAGRTLKKLENIPLGEPLNS